MITIILTRFPLSSEALGPRVVLHEFLGEDVSLGPWEPLPHTKASSAQFCYSYPTKLVLNSFLKQFLCI